MALAVACGKPEPTPVPTASPTATGGPEECKPVTYEQPKFATDDGTWRKADPETRKLLEVSAKYTEYLFSFPGVFAVGVGPGAITVRTKTAQPISAMWSTRYRVSWTGVQFR